MCNEHVRASCVVGVLAPPVYGTNGPCGAQERGAGISTPLPSQTFATHAAGRGRDTEVERTCAGRERGVARQRRLLFITAGLWQ